MQRMHESLNEAILVKVTAMLMSPACKISTPFVRFTQGQNTFNFYVSVNEKSFECLTYFSVEYNEKDFALYFEGSRAALNRVSYSDGVNISPMLSALAQLIKNKITNPKPEMPEVEGKRDGTGISLDGILVVGQPGSC